MNELTMENETCVLHDVMFRITCDLFPASLSLMSRKSVLPELDVFEAVLQVVEHAELPELVPSIAHRGLPLESGPCMLLW